MGIKTTLLILAVVAGILHTFKTYISVAHWLNTGCNMASHNPIVLPISWIIWAIFTYTTWLKGIDYGTAIYWFLAVIWGASNLYFSWCMIHYWLGL
jgi:hypothetical protein